MSEWKEYRFVELLEEPVRNGIYKKKEFHGRGTKIVNMGELFSYPRLIDTEMKRVVLNANEKNKCLLKNGDLIFARRSLTAEGAGKCSLIYRISEDITFESSIIRARPNDTKTSPEFLYYFFNSPYGSYLLGTILRQVAVSGITGKDLMDLVLKVPSRDTQSKIASILSSLDNKIDLLHRQNITLEQLAETLFRHWFIEEANSSSDEKNLDELVEFNPREKIDFQKEYTFYEMKCLSNDSMSISDGVKRIAQSATNIRNGDTLLAKITPCLENGKIGFVMHLDENEIGRGSTEFIVMRGKGKTSPYWVYCLARSQDFRATAILSMTGTSGRQRVQVDVLKDYKVKVNHDIMNSFHETVHHYFDKIKVNQIQIRTLTQLRDTLLPKLMTGKLGITLGSN